MKKIDIEKIDENFITLIGKEWMLITAGREEAFNTMTASWGAMGYLWGKPVAVVFIRPQRHTFEFVEREERFTLSFFSKEYKNALNICGTKSGRDCNKVAEAKLTPVALSDDAIAFEEARLVISCRKLYKSEMKECSFIDKTIIPKWYGENDFHYVYVAEIEEAWEKE